MLKCNIYIYDIISQTSGKKTPINFTHDFYALKASGIFFWGGKLNNSTPHVIVDVVFFPEMSESIASTMWIWVRVVADLNQ